MLGVNALSGGGVADRDPHWDKVVFLSEFDEADGVTVFRDERSHAITTNGNAVASGGQLSLDGTGDYLTCAESVDFNGFSVNDVWTVECFAARPTATTGVLITIGDNAGGACAQFNLETYAGQQNIYIRPQGGSLGWYIGNAFTFSSAKEHYRFTSNGTGGSGLKIYRNGVSLGTPTSFSYTTQNAPDGLIVGAGRGIGSYGSFHTGTIDGVRITKALRNTGDFTVPTLPYQKG